MLGAASWDGEFPAEPAWQALGRQGCSCWNPAWIIPVPFQRIAAADLAPGLMYFGCSIHGQLDLNEDGLVDLAVGSLGNAVLLW